MITRVAASKTNNVIHNFNQDDSIYVKYDKIREI